MDEDRMGEWQFSSKVQVDVVQKTVILMSIIGHGQNNLGSVNPRKDTNAIALDVRWLVG